MNNFQLTVVGLARTVRRLPFFWHYNIQRQSNTNIDGGIQLTHNLKHLGCAREKTMKCPECAENDEEVDMEPFPLIIGDVEQGTLFYRCPVCNYETEENYIDYEP